MASLKELLELSNKGDIGKLLVKEFGGELGRTYPRKDADFIIVYPVGSKAPKTESIKQAIATHYTKLGYVLDLATDNNRCFQVNITLPGNEKFDCIILVITTNYPFDGHHRCIRVTTEPTMVLDDPF